MRMKGTPTDEETGFDGRHDLFLRRAGPFPHLSAAIIPLYASGTFPYLPGTMPAVLTPTVNSIGPNDLPSRGMYPVARNFPEPY